MKMRYVGGFYGSEIAHEEATKIIVSGQGDYLIIAGEEGTIIGYRVESKSKALIEIDLSWGYLYPALFKLVMDDIDMRKTQRNKCYFLWCLSYEGNHVCG